MKNIINIILVALIFSNLTTFALGHQKKTEQNLNRVLLVSDVEKTKVGLANNLEGDYFIGFNGQSEKFLALSIDERLTLVDEEKLEYGSVEYYKDNDYEEYIYLVGKLLSEPIIDYVNFTTGENNLTDKTLGYYKDSLEHIKSFDTYIQGNGGKYDSDDSAIWIEIFKVFGIETNDLMDKEVLKDNRRAIQESEDYSQKMKSVFFKIYKIKLDCDETTCKFNSKGLEKYVRRFNNIMIMDIEYVFPDISKSKALDNNVAEEEEEIISETYEDAYGVEDTYESADTYESEDTYDTSDEEIYETNEQDTLDVLADEYYDDSSGEYDDSAYNYGYDYEKEEE